MSSLIPFLAACVLAAAVPFLSHPATSTANDAFPGWPTHFEGRPLRQIPLGEREQAFAEAFPGRIGRFTDGEREIILRWVTSPTRRLHPATDCFRGLGYSITPLPLHIDSGRGRWSAFRAEKDGKTLLVRERIVDMDGKYFLDVSSWFWAAVAERTVGPWWAVTEASRSE